jgi:hypothetical protein
LRILAVDATALGGAQIQRVTSRAQTERIGGTAALLQNGDLRSFRRHRVRAGKGAVVLGNTARAGECPGRATWLINPTTTGQNRRFEAAVGNKRAIELHRVYKRSVIAALRIEPG